MIKKKELHVSFSWMLLDSFKIYDKDQDGKIKLHEFYDFVRDSWVTAFRLLGE